MEVSMIDKKPLIISVAVFVLAIAIAVGAGIFIKSCNKPPEKIYTTEDYKYESDISGVKDILNTKDEKFLLLVNKQNPLGESYVPDGITEVDKAYTLYEKEVKLDGSAAAAIKALIDEMRALGYEGIYVTSGYRDYAYQKNLYEHYMYEEYLKDPELTEAEREEKVLTYSALPGASEHQSGLCVDLFVIPEMKDLVNYKSESQKGGVGFADTKEFEWLRENAHKFGYIIRYPDGKDGVTGYQYESWHYRFVGVDAATKIYEGGITLEEYLG